MKEISMDYIAGIIDGEGYIGLWKGNSKSQTQTYQCGVKIAMVGAGDLLWALHDEFGGHIEHRKGNGNHRDSICWSLRGKKLLAKFLEDITPHLALKRNQAELLHEYCTLGMLHPLYAPPERMARAREIYEQLQTLKWQLPATTKRGRPDQVMLKVKR